MTKFDANSYRKPSVTKRFATKIDGAPKFEPDAPPIAPGTWRDHIFSAATLKTMTFKAVQYVVPDIVPEGVTILAGKPKIGNPGLP